MHEVHETLHPGAVIRSRYLVIDLLGTGGFSAVYLVQDLQREEHFFALKEMNTAHKNAGEHFSLEYGLLERLDHPALPHVHSVFDNDEHDRLYMLMDYVEGPNLETLRFIQHEKRFAIPDITSIIAPTVDAIAYLHQQHPPIIHRDIKPSNIIIPIVEKKTVLVDLGIAKEHEAQGTTSAVRYGSPGYGAPEQYTTGTNTRTDIYGLGATLYTLLTGEIPPDALDRMTQLSNDKPDPLKPPHELVPSIPMPVSNAILRAMSINMMQRFATVHEFWQAFQGESGQQPHITDALNSIGVSPSTPVISGKSGAPSSQTPQVKQLPGRRSSKRFLLPVFLTLLLIVGIGASFWGYTLFKSNQVPNPIPSIAQPSILTAIAQPTPAVTGTMPSKPFHLAPLYTGIIKDVQVNVTSQMILTVRQQGNGNISGTFSGLQMSRTFRGSLLLDQSKQLKIYFNIAASSNNRPLSFSGDVLPDGSLNGLFCETDRNGSCNVGGTNGWWNATPAVH